MSTEPTPQNGQESSGGTEFTLGVVIALIGLGIILFAPKTWNIWAGGFVLLAGFTSPWWMDRNFWK